MRTRLQAAGLLALVAAAGCSSDTRPPTGQVSGKVTYKGQPVAGGTVIFVSAADPKESGAGQIQADGSYRVFDAPAGPCKVVVKGRRPGDPPPLAQGKMPYQQTNVPRGAGVPKEVLANSGGNPPAGVVNLPAKAADPATTPLTFTVGRDKEQTFDVVLTD